MSPADLSPAQAKHVRYATLSDFARVVGYEWRTRRAWASWRAGLRGLWWWLIRRYAFELCQDCGRPVGRAIAGTWWRAPDELWLRVVGTQGGTLCPQHFTDRAERQGIRIHWEAVSGV